MQEQTQALRDSLVHTRIPHYGNDRDAVDRRGRDTTWFVAAHHGVEAMLAHMHAGAHTASIDRTPAPARHACPAGTPTDHWQP